MLTLQVKGASGKGGGALFKWSEHQVHILSIMGDTEVAYGKRERESQS